MSTSGFDDERIATTLPGHDSSATPDDRDPGDPQRGRQEAVDATVAALDLLYESAPPPELRSRLLAAAVRERPEQPGSGVAELFAHQVDALAELLDELDDDEWIRPVGPYDWTVHGLVAHLLVIENYTASRLGLAPDDPTDEHHLTTGAGRIADELAGDPERTAAAWRERAAATSAALRDTPTELPADVVLHGWRFPLDGAIIARSFEIWTHADDIRRATGRPVRSPGAADLRTMSRFSVQALPLTLGLVAPDRELSPTRVVLTGEGGGTFDLGSAPGTPTTIVLDVVDYCLVAARRIDPDQLVCMVEGETELVTDLLRGAAAFAV